MRTILIVDDDKGIIEALTAMLEFSGFDVKTCMDAKTLKKVLKDHLPDLILLDVFLSGDDGRVLCKQLKADIKTKNIPVIMISAHPDIQKSVQEVGANDFISKPFNMQDLLTKIDNNINAGKRSNTHFKIKD